MKDFKQNICRVCRKIFCCKKCREKHETKEHNIHVECDICLNGRIIFKDISENLLEHLKSAHWPLHCVFCNRLFGTSDELVMHKKCPVGYHQYIDKPVDNITYTPPIRSFSEKNYESPPFSQCFQKGSDQNLNVLSNLVTSTPMPRAMCGENNIMEKMQVVTPVEYPDQQKMSIIKKTSENSDQSLKRKVTFCETPVPEVSKKQKLQNKETDSVLGTIQPHHINSFSGCTTTETFYSIKEDSNKFSPAPAVEEVQNLSFQSKAAEIVSNKDVTSENKAEEIPIEEEIQIQEENTLWISAENVSTLETSISENKDDSVAPENTPADVLKFRKRKINIVNPLIRKDLGNLASSTPTTSYVPKICKIENRENVANENVETPSNASLPIKEELSDNLTELSAISNGSNLDSISQENNKSLWLTMGKMVKKVIKDFSKIKFESGQSANNSSSIKRSFSDTNDWSSDEPQLKRYKLTEIKCRRTIRELPSMESSAGEFPSIERYREPPNFVSCEENVLLARNTSKVYVDKATQTD